MRLQFNNDLKWWTLFSSFYLSIAFLGLLQNWQPFATVLPNRNIIFTCVFWTVFVFVINLPLLFPKQKKNVLKGHGILIAIILIVWLTISLNNKDNYARSLGLISFVYFAPIFVLTLFVLAWGPTIIKEKLAKTIKSQSLKVVSGMLLGVVFILFGCIVYLFILTQQFPEISTVPSNAWGSFLRTVKTESLNQQESKACQMVEFMLPLTPVFKHDFLLRCPIQAAPTGRWIQNQPFPLISGAELMDRAGSCDDYLGYSASTSIGGFCAGGTHEGFIVTDSEVFEKVIKEKESKCGRYKGNLDFVGVDTIIDVMKQQCVVPNLGIR